MDRTQTGGCVPPEGEMIYPSFPLQFRAIKANEVVVRPAETRNGKAKLLLYKDARVDRRILDETVGALNWQSDYFEEHGMLFCKIGVKNPITQEWIWKADTGSESNIEAEKGHASDAFKRAAFAFGIGKELYTTPVISIDIEEKDMYQGKFTQSFSVSEMSVEDGYITSLTIVDKWGKKRYEFNSQATVQTERQVKPVMAEQPFKLVQEGCQDKEEKLEDVLDEIYKDMPQKQSANDMIKEFCIRKKGEAGVDLRQLNNFYRFYTSPSKDSPDKSIAESFKNLDPERLWERWMEKAK